MPQHRDEEWNKTAWKWTQIFRSAEFSETAEQSKSPPLANVKWRKSETCCVTVRKWICDAIVMMLGSNEKRMKGNSKNKQVGNLKAPQYLKTSPVFFITNRKKVLSETLSLSSRRIHKEQFFSHKWDKTQTWTQTYSKCTVWVLSEFHSDKISGTVTTTRLSVPVITHPSWDRRI